MTSVSVIIPVFNNRETLERAVLSVVHEPLISEIFLVDDGSSDGSILLAKNLAEKHSLIKLVFHPKQQNKGAPASRNLGLAHATSDWIQFLDADDELKSGKLAGQMDMVNPETALVVGNSIHVFPKGWNHYRKADNEIWKGLIRSKLGDTCANLWNRKFLLEVGGWNEDLSSSQEYDLMFRVISRHPKVVFDNRYLTLIHQSENSISTRPDKKEERIKNWLDLRHRIRAYLIEIKCFDMKKQYYWSGAVGIFCEQYQTGFPFNMQKYLFHLYKFELFFKKKVYQILKN